MAVARLVAVGWSLMALAGLLVNLWALQDARLDLEFVKRYSHLGTRYRLARAYVRREAIQVTTQAAFLAAGIISYLHPPTEALTATRFAISTAFVLAAILLVANSVLDQQARRAVMREIERQEQEAHDEANRKVKARAEAMRAELKEKKGQT